MNTGNTGITTSWYKALPILTYLPTYLRALVRSKSSYKKVWSFITDIERSIIIGCLPRCLNSDLYKDYPHPTVFPVHPQNSTIMLAVGHHDYYYFNHLGTVLCMTIGDCESPAARRFINSVPEHMFNQLATAIGNRIWGPNAYNVQNEVYMIW